MRVLSVLLGAGSPVPSWIIIACGWMIVLVHGYTPSKPPFLTRLDMCGIWKLSHTTTASNEDSPLMVLRLKEDGTFDDMGDKATWLSRGGCWEYQEECLLLAVDRPQDDNHSKGPDTLLKGTIQVQVTTAATNEATSIDQTPSISPAAEETINSNLEENPNKNDDSNNPTTATDNVMQQSHVDVHLSIPQGQIVQGKFLYPKKHNAFFEQPMLFQPTLTGTFTMQQLLGNRNARLQQQQANTHSTGTVAKFHKKDLHNRTFYLTATPHPVYQGYAERDIHYQGDTATLDVSVIPLTFYPNQTFAAIGVEKILRGRFGITGEQRDKLWFQVSLYGAGRSAPGSVYSEGRFLSQEDRRGYVGVMQSYEGRHNQTTLFVQGEYYYGSSDLRKARKANSMGTFTLQEIDDMDDDSDEEDDDVEDVCYGNTDGTWDESNDAFQ